MDYQEVQNTQAPDPVVPVSNPLELLAAYLLSFDTDIDLRATSSRLPYCDCAAPNAIHSEAVAGWVCVVCLGVVRGES